jgi:hypothetical protein
MYMYVYIYVYIYYGYAEHRYMNKCVYMCIYIYIYICIYLEIYFSMLTDLNPSFSNVRFGNFLGFSMVV